MRFIQQEVDLTLPDVVAESRVLAWTKIQGCARYTLFVLQRAVLRTVKTKDAANGCSGCRVMPTMIALST